MRLLLLLLFLIGSLYAQDFASVKQLYRQYESYREPSITQRRFKHADLQPLIQSLREDERFQVRVLGQSIEGKDISLISIGNGPVDVLLWSQMHGDEPTATMALMDIFRFLRDQRNNRVYLNQVLSQVRLHFIPMLNPDGADRFLRRTTLAVDLNRDALRLQNPEARILKRVRDSLEADWGFNLHDQGRYYAAGLNPHTASISFLAPAYNYEKEINEKRGDAMRLIGNMNGILQHYIPNKVGRYNDDFEPRAFGDNIQKWGTRTILIESGHLKDDPEKQYLRKLHFVILLAAFQDIAAGSYQATGLEEYEGIPFNESNGFHELILRQAQVEKQGETYTLDLGFRHWEVNYNESKEYYLRGAISDIGDLSTSFAYQEFDASDFQCEMGKAYPRRFKNLQKLRQQNLEDLLREGYTVFRLKKLPEPWECETLPLQLIPAKADYELQLKPGANPSLCLMREGKVQYWVVNGMLFSEEEVKKALE